MAEMEIQTSVWLFSGVAPGSKGEEQVKKQITSGGGEDGVEKKHDANCRRGKSGLQEAPISA